MTQQEAGWVMTKVVVASLRSSSRDRVTTSVAEKRVLDADGRVKTLRTLDIASSTFGRDLEYVFGKNVAKARRENRRVTGASDGVVAKR
jgi:hypothetical protein